MSTSKDLYDKFVGSLGQPNPLYKPDAFFFGTVTSVRPVKVRLDGDTTPAAGNPILLTPNAVVGSRVLCQLHGRQLIVVAVVFPKLGNADQLGNTEHLDDLIDGHTWHQPMNVNTSTSRGYPVALAGLLEVYRGADGFVYQRYTVYDGTGVYWRVKYNTSWSAWGTTALKPQIYNLSGNISNFLLSGRISVEVGPDGKRKAEYNVLLTRTISNYGTLPTTSWTNLGTLVPVAARFTAVFNPNYVIAIINTGSTSLPLDVAIGQDTGAISIKGVTGLTTTVNVNDFIQITTTFLEA